MRTRFYELRRHAVVTYIDDESLFHRKRPGHGLGLAVRRDDQLTSAAACRPVRRSINQENKL